MKKLALCLVVLLALAACEATDNGSCQATNSCRHRADASVDAGVGASARD